MFSALLGSVKYEVTTILAKVHVPSEEEMREMALKLREQQENKQAMEYIHEDAHVEAFRHGEREEGYGREGKARIAGRDRGTE